MVHFTIPVLLALAATAFAAPQPITPDPSGAQNVGTGNGRQFITGGCLTTADCSQASSATCCAGITGDPSIGVCSALAVADVNGKSGCGFGDKGPADPAGTAGGRAGSQVPPPPPPVRPGTETVFGDAAQCQVQTALAGSQNVGLGTKAQFITGQCLGRADCASNCCVLQAASGRAECKAEVLTRQQGLSCDFTCD